ncbi:MAG: hypothetical protein ABMA64_24080, partial [Myxococcota bacterium]
MSVLPEGWTAREAPFEGAGATLQRVDGPLGAVGLAVRVRPDLADHPLVQKGMDEVAPFVRRPGVPGVLPMVAWDRPRALFVYRTEPSAGLTVAELLDRCAERGVAGERAAVELVAKVAAV